MAFIVLVESSLNLMVWVIWYKYFCFISIPKMVESESFAYFFNINVHLSIDNWSRWSGLPLIDDEVGSRDE